MSASTALLLGALLLLGNAFFVGAEFAVMTVRRSQLEPLAAQGKRRAAVALQALEQVASLLVCAQLGITVCSLLLGAVAESALHELLANPLAALGLSQALAHPIALVLALLVVAYFHVVVGEMIPKNLAIAGPNNAALLLAPPLLYLTRVLRPLIRLMEWTAKLLVRMFRVEPKDEITSAFTVEEVQLIVAESRSEGLIREDAHGLLKGALEFSDRVAAEVAVPVENLVTVPVGATPADIEYMVAKRGFSRYPVRDADGQLTGYLHLKDILYAAPHDYARPVPATRVRRLAVVAPDAEVEDVLAVMQRSGSHLARVVDADEQVIGIVFLEDVLEQLVGEVTDQAQR